MNSTPSILNCKAVRSHFSAYLDGAISGTVMQSLARHLESCSVCTADFAQWRAMQRSLATLGPAQGRPQTLPCACALRSPYETAQNRITWLDKVELAWKNTVAPFALQASGRPGQCRASAGNGHPSARRRLCAGAGLGERRTIRRSHHATLPLCLCRFGDAADPCRSGRPAHRGPRLSSTPAWQYLRLPHRLRLYIGYRACPDRRISCSSANLSRPRCSASPRAEAFCSPSPVHLRPRLAAPFPPNPSSLCLHSPYKPRRTSKTREPSSQPTVSSASRCPSTPSSLTPHAGSPCWSVCSPPV